MAAAQPAPALQNRLRSLDQFRGYTVAGMFLVNYLGHSYYATPFILQHHSTFCSYADTIMPQFFFAVGFSFRLSFGRRAITEGLGKAYWHVVKRLLGLVVVAVVLTYHAKPPLPNNFTWEELKELGVWGAIWPHAIKNTWFQTLVHIAVTSLWILPVIRLRARWRVLYMIFSGLLHLGLSYLFNFDWVNGIHPYEPRGIDGGPLGFLSWTIPTMVGTLACDAVMSQRGILANASIIFGWGVILMALGWTASCATRWYDVPADQVAVDASVQYARKPVFPAKEDVAEWWSSLKARDWKRALAEPPFVPPPHSKEPVPIRERNGELKRDKEGNQVFTTEDLSYQYRKWNYWMMSQRAGSISYLTFAAGLSLLVYALFYILADMIGFRIGVFRTLGTNALFGYVLADLVEEAVKPFVSKDAPPIAMWISFGVFFFFCWLIIRSLEKRKIYIKL